MAIKTYMMPKVYRPKKYPPVTRMPIEHDFLKYIGLVRKYVLRHYKLSAPYFDMLCFLHSEGIFNVKSIEKYNQILGFAPKKRKDMIDMGLISVFRKGTVRTVPMYELSHTGRAIMRDVYARLLGEKPITEIKRPTRYSERQFNRVAKRANEDFKARRQRPELL
jgi:hypothetical protein